MVLGLSPVPPQRQSAIVVPEDVPVYRARSACYLDDDLYPEGSVFTWPDEPNVEMEPMNAIAREVYKKFIDKLDDLGRAAAEKAGKGYTSYADAYENSIVLAQQEGKRVQLLNGKKTVPLMGSQKNKRAKTVDLPPEVSAPAGVGKHSLGSKAEGFI